MTGHSLTLLVGNEPVNFLLADYGAGRPGPKRQVALLKDYIRRRRDTLQFTPNNIKTFPWLREVLGLPMGPEDFARDGALAAARKIGNEMVTGLPRSNGPATRLYHEYEENDHNNEKDMDGPYARRSGRTGDVDVGGCGSQRPE